MPQSRFIHDGLTSCGDLYGVISLVLSQMKTFLSQSRFFNFSSGVS